MPCSVDSALFPETILNTIHVTDHDLQLSFLQHTSLRTIQNLLLWMVSGFNLPMQKLTSLLTPEAPALYHV